MSIELKQAAQQALEALTFIRRQLKSWDRGDSVIDALRTALAQQPATPEPVGFTYRTEIEYADFTGRNGSFWRVPPDLDGEAVPLCDHPAPSVPADVMLDCYDAGVLNDFGGGNVEWWQDYIRAELGDAHNFYQSQIDAALLAASPGQEGNGMSIEAMELALAALENTKKLEHLQDYGLRQKAIDSVRTALSQQPDNAACKSVQKRLAAQQPATPETVAWMASYVDPIGNDRVYVTSHHDLAVENDMHGTPRPLVFGDTHPAPSVPGDDFDLICNAIDKADTITMEGDYMLDSDDCIAVVRVMQVLLSVRAAMLAAKKPSA